MTKKITIDGKATIAFANMEEMGKVVKGRDFWNIEEETMNNSFFRKVIFTGRHQQLVLMKIEPLDEIGFEIHEDTDQFFRIEKGSARFVLGNDHSIKHLNDNDAIIIKAGMRHNVINDSPDEPLFLYTIYSPPHHPEGTIIKKKTDLVKIDIEDKARLLKDKPINMIIEEAIYRYSEVMGIGKFDAIGQNYVFFKDEYDEMDKNKRFFIKAERKREYLRIEIMMRKSKMETGHLLSELNRIFPWIVKEDSMKPREILVSRTYDRNTEVTFEIKEGLQEEIEFQSTLTIMNVSEMKEDKLENRMAQLFLMLSMLMETYIA